MKRHRNRWLARRNRARRSRRLRAERLEARLLLAADFVFEDSGQRLGESQTRDVALGDFDGDGDLDAFVLEVEEERAIRVWLNDDGYFTSEWWDFSDYSGCRYPTAVALGYLNDDGILDAFVSVDGGKGGCTPHSGANEVWFGNGDGDKGDGTFRDSGQRLGDSSSRAVFLGHLNEDDYLDVFVAARGHWAANEVWLNDGSGFFTNTGQRLGGYESLDVDLADLDSDGDLDAFVANSAQRTKTKPGGFSQIPNPDKVWLNDGSGFFTDSGQELLVGSVDSRSYGVSLGDLDGDGDYDAFVADNGAGVLNQVWLNDGTGTFDKGESLGTARARDLSLGDVDGDGDLDAVVANSLDYGSEVWLNDGTATFDDSGQSLAPDRSSGSVALGDLDGDSDLDIFLGNGSHNSDSSSWPDMVWWNVVPSPPTPGITVSPTSGLLTSEDSSSAAYRATFTVVLDTAPTGPVTIVLESSDNSEGVLIGANQDDQLVLTFDASDWDQAQTVTVEGVDDADIDGDVEYSIITQPASGAAEYSGIDPDDVSVTNLDDDSATKYFVVDDGVGQTFEYDSAGTVLGFWNLASENPRGAAASADGRTVWVIDSNKSVYVYNADGTSLGSWKAGGLKQPQGIATDETDIWIVDGKRIYWYIDAANHMSGPRDPDFYFVLPGGGSGPKGITTNGTSLWVVIDGKNSDEVLKYDISSADLVGSWALDTANSKPTGITIDPSGASSSIWIVDSGTDMVYEYENALGDTGGTLIASPPFPLAVGNPQGIADPPVSQVADPVTSPALDVGTTVFREQRTVVNWKGVATPSPKLVIPPFAAQGEMRVYFRAVDLVIDRCGARPLRFRTSVPVPNKVFDRARDEAIAELGDQLSPNLDDNLLTTLATMGRQS